MPTGLIDLTLLVLGFLALLIGEEPGFEKCDIKGDNLCVTGPTKNLYILKAEVVLIPAQLPIELVLSIQNI